jgi:hypothetical protein
MDTGGPFPGIKHSQGVMLTTHPHVMPRPIMSRSLKMETAMKLRTFCDILPCS